MASYLQVQNVSWLDLGIVRTWKRGADYFALQESHYICIVKTICDFQAPRDNGGCPGLRFVSSWPTYCIAHGDGSATITSAWVAYCPNQPFRIMVMMAYTNLLTSEAHICMTGILFFSRMSGHYSWSCLDYTYHHTLNCMEICGTQLYVFIWRQKHMWLLCLYHQRDSMAWFQRLKSTSVFG